MTIIQADPTIGEDVDADGAPSACEPINQT